MQKFRSNAVVKFNGNFKAKKIAIKTERDVEHRLQVKKEPNVPKVAKTKPNQNDWNTEKRKMIDQIVALKTENQRNHMDLKKQKMEIAKIMLEKQELEQKLAVNDVQFSSQMSQLRSELTDAKQDIVQIKSTNDKIISGLKNETKLLIARNKQLQAGMEQKKSATATDSATKSASENDYEVEQIIAHKTVRTHRQYLIRWKGYDSDDDTWEKASDLKCPKLLNAYLNALKEKK